MSLTINHNLSAQNTARNLDRHYGRLQISTQRLSSGLRINSAADDAAGLAIRELMRSEVAALNQGMRNANDAISMLQVADGALAVIDEKLIRMKELAEQAATGTYNSTQRLMIDSEFQAMGAEIDRIAYATNFNGQYLLDGSRAYGHDGSGLNSTGRFKIHFGAGNDSAEDYYYVAIGDASLRGLGLAKSSPNWWNAADIDYDNNRMVLNIGGGVAGANSPNGVTGMAGMDYYNLPVGLKNITVSSTSSGFAHKPHVNLFTKDGQQLTGVSINGEWKGKIYVSVPVAGSSNPTLYDSVEVPKDCYAPDYGLPRLKDEYCDYSTNPPTLKAAIQNVIPDADLGKGILVDGDSTRPWWNNASSGSVIAAGQQAGLFNPGAVYDASQIINNAGETVTAGGSTITMITNQNEVARHDEIINISEITDELVFIIGGHENGFCNVYDLKIEAEFDENFIAMVTAHNSNGAISIETQQAAQEALVKVDNAIVKKDKIRAHLGAMQNRLENTVSNLSIQSENLQAAESRISDADIATEMTQFVRNQILTQSAVAMLSQANSLPQMAMQLIG